MAMAAGNGEDFARLWRGDWSGYSSQSEADLALCNHLAFWCGPDEQRIADLFAQSGLNRTKWQREDYRRRTIRKALEGRTEYYEWPGAQGHYQATGANGHPGTAGNGQAGNPPPPPPRTEQPWQPPIPLNTIPEAESFPLWTLPESLQRFVTEAAGALNCPQDFVAVPMLALAGGAIGNTRRVAITRSHQQGACLFAVCVGRPGSAKSPALNLVVEPLEAAERRYRSEWDMAMKLWKKEEPDERGDPPIQRRTLLSDTTTEKMADLLNENARGLMMVRDEAAAIVTGQNQYKGGKGHDRQVYLQLWAQAAIRVDRKNGLKDGAPVIVYRPFVGIIGGIQPSVVDGLRRGEGRGTSLLDDGFLDRFLFNYPPDVRAVGERWREVSPEAVAAWTGAVERLLLLGMVGERTGPRVQASVFTPPAEDEKCRPFVLRLDADGRVAWQRFTDRHAAELNDTEFPDYLRGPWSKLLGYCGRLALILHCLRWACGDQDPVYAVDPVDGVSMGAAARLIDYFKSHARKLYAALDADPRIAQARKVLQCLARNPKMSTFTRRDLYQHLRKTFKKPEGLDAPLRLLVEYRYIRPVGGERQGRPGPAPERYEISPVWLSQMRTQRTQRTQDDESEGEPVYGVYGVYGSEDSEA
jgi:hypothetical protein